MSSIDHKPLTRQERRQRWRDSHPDWKQRQAAYEKKSKERPEYRTREQQRNARNSHGKWALAPDSAVIVTLDGENIVDRRYALLQAFDGEKMYTYESAPGTEITLTQGLAFARSIAREIRQRTHKRAYFYFFGMHYDVDQMIGHDESLSLAVKAVLNKHRSRAWGSVRGPDFQNEIEYRTPNNERVFVHNGRKTLTARYTKWDSDATQYAAVRFYDALSLQPGSFLGIYDGEKGWARRWTAEEKTLYDPMLETVRAGKALRDNWGSWGNAEIAHYNECELRLYHWYLTKIIDLCVTTGLSPRSLAGPAPLARSLATQYGVTPHIKPENYDTVDFQESAIMDAVRGAMHAGRIEMAGQGVVANVHNYDINSAHPDGIRKLPCLAHGEWKHWDYSACAQITASSDVPDYGVVKITWRMPTSERWGPFPVRQDNGGIKYPLSAAGWIPTPEIRAYLENEPNGALWDIAEIWEWVPDCENTHPFAHMIEDTYARRLTYKEIDDPAEYPLKLAMNSFYGVMAQTAGSHRIIDDDGNTTGYKTPKFSNLFGAALITSETRAKIYRALRTDPDAVISIMTDGLYCLRPLNLALSTELGGWGHKLEKENHLFISPGVVFQENAGKSKVRGMPMRPDYAEITATIASGQQFHTMQVKEYQSLTQALRNGKLASTWGTFIGKDYNLDVSEMALISKRDIFGKSESVGAMTFYPPYQQSGMGKRYKRAFDRATSDDWYERDGVLFLGDV